MFLLLFSHNQNPFRPIRDNVIILFKYVWRWNGATEHPRLGDERSVVIV